MRLLPERPDPHGEGVARSESESDRCADSRRHGRRFVPMHDVLPRSGGHQARRERHGTGMTLLTPFTGTRREFLARSGMLVVGIAAAASAPASTWIGDDQGG